MVLILVLNSCCGFDKETREIRGVSKRMVAVVMVSILIEGCDQEIMRISLLCLGKGRKLL